MAVGEHAAFMKVMSLDGQPNMRALMIEQLGAGEDALNMQERSLDEIAAVSFVLVLCLLSFPSFYM